MISKTDSHDDTAALVWLIEASEYARTNGKTRLLCYLESVAEDVLFEMESSSRST